MKRVGFALAGAAAMLLASGITSGAHAQVELGGDLTIVSDYVFRGVSQTTENPAVQGGLELGLPSGFYVGTWASSIYFGEAAVELDAYGGIAPTVGDFDLDLGVVYYGYPASESDDNFSFIEIYGSASREFGPLGAGLSAAYSPDFFGASGAALYGELGASFTIPDAPLTLSASIGKQTIDDEEAFGLPDFLTWSAGASVDVLGASVGATIIGSDISSDLCDDICGTRFVVGVSRGF